MKHETINPNLTSNGNDMMTAHDLRVRQKRLEALSNHINTLCQDEWKDFPYECTPDFLDKEGITDEELASFAEDRHSIDDRVAEIADDVPQAHEWTQEEVTELAFRNLDVRRIDIKARVLLDSRCLLRLDGTLIVQFYVQYPDGDGDVMEEWIEQQFPSVHEFIKCCWA